MEVALNRRFLALSTTAGLGESMSLSKETVGSTAGCDWSGIERCGIAKGTKVVCGLEILKGGSRRVWTAVKAGGADGCGFMSAT